MGINPHAPPSPGDGDRGESQFRGPLHISRLLPIEARGVTHVYDAEPARSPAFTFSHDEEEGLFVLTSPDGSLEKFRDKPARQLVVELDPETGEMRPAMKNGLPVFLYLCREERERG